jgi:hypothetical protein
MFTMPSLRRFGWGLLVLSLLIAGSFRSAQAVVVTVNFDALAATGTSVTGAALDAYLAGFPVAITISNVTPTGYPEVHDASDHGPLSGFPAGFLTASSPPNFLSHGDGVAGGGANAPTNSPISYRLNFSTPLDSVSFTRIQQNAFTSPSGSIVAAWSARALDSSGNTIFTVGEPQLASFGIIPAAMFTLPGPNIAALVVERTSTNFVAGVNAVFIDDLVLQFTPSVPEPTTLALMALGLAVVGFTRRRQVH